MKRHKPSCPLCRARLRVVFRGTDPGETFTRARHRGRANPTPDDKFYHGEFHHPLPGPRYRYRRHLRADHARRPYRLELRCTGQIDKGVHCPAGVVIYARDHAAAVHALHRRLAFARRQLAGKGYAPPPPRVEIGPNHPRPA